MARKKRLKAEINESSILFKIALNNSDEKDRVSLYKSVAQEILTIETIIVKLRLE